MPPAPRSAKITRVWSRVVVQTGPKHGLQVDFRPELKRLVLWLRSWKALLCPESCGWPNTAGDTSWLISGGCTVIGLMWCCQAGAGAADPALGGAGGAQAPGLPRLAQRCHRRHVARGRGRRWPGARAGAHLRAGHRRHRVGRRAAYSVRPRCWCAPPAAAADLYHLDHNP